MSEHDVCHASFPYFTILPSFSSSYGLFCCPLFMPKFIRELSFCLFYTSNIQKIEQLVDMTMRISKVIHTTSSLSEEVSKIISLLPELRRVILHTLSLIFSEILSCHELIHLIAYQIVTLSPNHRMYRHL